MLKYITITVLIVIAGIISLCFRLGVFKNVSVRVAMEEPFDLIFAEHTGPYHKIVPVIEKVETWVRSNGGKCNISFGEYLDDPKLVPEDRLKSRGGCVAEPGINWAERLQSNPEIKFESRPSGKYLVLWWDGSPSLAPLLVYPKAEREARERGLKISGPVLEFYQILGQKEGVTRYLFQAQ